MDWDRIRTDTSTDLEIARALFANVHHVSVFITFMCKLLKLILFYGIVLHSVFCSYCLVREIGMTVTIFFPRTFFNWLSNMLILKLDMENITIVQKRMYPCPKYLCIVRSFFFPFASYENHVINISSE